MRIGYNYVPLTAFSLLVPRGGGGGVYIFVPESEHVTKGILMAATHS